MWQNHNICFCFQLLCMYANTFPDLEFWILWKRALCKHGYCNTHKLNNSSARHKLLVHLYFNTLESVDHKECLNQVNMARWDVERHVGNKQGFFCWQMEVLLVELPQLHYKLSCLGVFGVNKWLLLCSLLSSRVLSPHKTQKLVKSFWKSLFQVGKDL